MRGRLLWASTAVLLAGCTAYKPVGEGSQVPWADALVSKRAALSATPGQTAQPQVQQASIAEGVPDVQGAAAAEPAAPARVGTEPVRVTALTSETEIAEGTTITPAVAREREAPAPAPATPKVRSHTVGKGEWLYEIARQYDVPAMQLAAANGIPAPYQLRPGQVLEIPADGATAVAIAKADDPSRTVPAATPATARPTHVVARGDALYGVARQYGVSPKELALANQLEPDAYLMPGQELVIPAAGAVETAPAETVVAEAVVVETPAPVAEAASPDAAFVWPVDGKVIAMFGEEDDGETRSGIAIEARKGAPVKAARDGVVVYAGDAIRGYGRMILLRHDDGYVTAYGHNSAILVNVGDTVEQGQVIARVGDTGGVATPQLHFEVRQGKQPIDPTTVLTARPTAVAQSTG